MKRKRLITLAATAALAAAAAVAFRTRRPPAQPHFAPLTGVEFSGCAAVLVGPVCEIEGETRLSLWVPGNHKLTAHTDSGPVSISGARPFDGGVAFRVTVPAGSRLLALEDHQRRKGWSLTLAAHEEPSPIRRAHELRASGKEAAARRMLEVALRSASADTAGRIHGMLGRLALARGEIDDSEKHFKESVSGAQRAGRYSDAAQDTLALAYALTTRTQELGRAAGALDAAVPFAAVDPEARARIPYYRGLIEAAAGNTYLALRSLRVGKRRAERLQMDALTRISAQQEAFVLEQMGRPKDAIRLWRGLLKNEEVASGCERSGEHLNFAWLLVHGGNAGPEAERNVRQGLDLLGTRCRDPYHRKNAHLTAALLALRNRDFTNAQKQLDAAAKVRAKGTALGLWEIDLGAELALLRGDARAALSGYQREAALAESVSARSELWRALAGQGEALAALRQPTRELGVLERAERVLSELMLRVPLVEGRESFLSDRESTARRLVALYLAQGRPREAYATARQARARALRAAAQADRIAELDPAQGRRWKESVGRYLRARRALEREAAGDWELAADQLGAARRSRSARTEEIQSALDDAYAIVSTAKAAPNPPPPVGSARLMYFPTDEGWVGFCEEHERLSLKRIGAELPTAPGKLATALLDPFAEVLERSDELVLFPYGDLRSVDFHALPWEGRPLLSSHSVSYGLDLGRPEAHEDSRTRALVVADPGGDLPQARNEGAMVTKALAGQGTDLLSGPAATRSAVLKLLPDAALFHYAGHGTFAGPTGGESFIALAGGSQIRVGDVLALPRVPRLVVLSACEAARASPEALPESLGVAQAFVTRGAQAVIAATRPIADDLARELVEKLYQQRGALPAELTRAQRAIAKAQPDADWAAYRVLVP